MNLVQYFYGENVISLTTLKLVPINNMISNKSLRFVCQAMRPQGGPGGAGQAPAERSGASTSNGLVSLNDLYK